MERNENGMPRATTTCDPASDPLDGRPLGYSYTPIQRWRMLYRPAEGLSRGTLFSELDLPFMGMSVTKGGYCRD